MQWLLLLTLCTSLLISQLGVFPDTDLDAARTIAALAIGRCVGTAQVDHARTVEEVTYAHEWNRLLIDTRTDAPLATPERGSVFGVDAALTMVDGWTPLIGCVAREFDIPPALLAGVVATELNVDYDWLDEIVDSKIRARGVIGEVFCYVAVGGGYASVHTPHLRRALATFGAAFSQSPFYRRYYQIVMSGSLPDVTRITTRYLPFDIANAAVMARYYALLRMGSRPLFQMSLTDMAFTWSAYRGGVSDTPSDPDGDYRWRLSFLQKADNPAVFGDTLIALPYFSYFRSVFKN
ncbi:MAG: hypothetical protein ABI947_07235 [Chloroflexota bacterium]